MEEKETTGNGSLNVETGSGQKKVPIGELFVTFLQFGLFTFGGGMSIVAQIQKTYAEQKKLIRAEEILDITSVGRSLPGTMIGNVAIMFGYHMGGVGGALASLFGMILPPFCILAVIARFYAAFKTNVIVASALFGIRAAVVPIIFTALLGMQKGAFRYPPCVVVSLLSFVLYTWAGVSCVWLVVLGIVSGLVMTEYYERRRSR